MYSTVHDQYVRDIWGGGVAGGGEGGDQSQGFSQEPVKTLLMKSGLWMKLFSSRFIIYSRDMQWRYALLGTSRL